MEVRQGEIYHLKLPPPLGSEPGYPRYAVIVQHDFKNGSIMKTTVVCLTTTAVDKAKARGNVVLMPDEGDLPQHSAVNVSQIVTLDKEVHLGQYMGKVYDETMPKILEAIRILLEGNEPKY